MKGTAIILLIASSAVPAFAASPADLAQRFHVDGTCTTVDANVFIIANQQVANQLGFVCERGNLTITLRADRLHPAGLTVPYYNPDGSIDTIAYE